MPQHTPIHLSIKETCARHNCCRSYLYNLAAQGKIIMRKNGQRTLVDVAIADAYFANLPPAKIKAPTAPAPQPIEPSPPREPNRAQPISDIAPSI